MFSLKFYYLSIIIILCANYLNAQDSTDGINAYTTTIHKTTTSTTSTPLSTTTSTTAESTTYTTTSTASESTTYTTTSTTRIPTSTTTESTTYTTTSTTTESTTYTTTSTTSESTTYTTTSTTAESTTYTTTSTTSTIPIFGTDLTTIDTTTVELNTNDYTSYYEVGNFTDFFNLNESTISNDYNETYDYSTTIEFGNETITFSNESTTYELTTKTSTTTAKPIILGTNEYKFNSSIVIVWEKCGLDARTKVTQIFKSIYSTHQLIYSYDPSINVIISEEITLNSTTPIRQVLKIPSNINGELIFFVFNEPGKVNLYLDCPSVSKHRFVLDLNVDLEYVAVFQNAKYFDSLSEAMNEFKCRSSITVLPGTVIHFNELFNLVGTSLLVSFTFDKESFSISLQNGMIVVTTSNQQLISLTLTQTITTSGIYLVFTELSLQFHFTCPTSLSIVTAAAYWNTTIFQSKLNIQTSRNHLFANVATSTLLGSFCSTNNLISIIDSGVTCVQTDKIQSNINIVNQANQIYLNFMPSTNIINQINTFNSKHSLNFGNLIENEPKILIASRDNADSEFFNKNLNEYVEGFSDGQSNFWIGLNVLNKATTSNNYKLRIVATTQNDIDLIEEYFEFHVGDADSNYRLGVNRQTLGIVSNAKGFFELNNGAGFSTYDFGDHKNMSRNLAGGWWHKEGMKNSYCFTCVNKMYAQGSAATISLAQLTDQDVLKTKMYLVPHERNTNETFVLPTTLPPKTTTSSGKPIANFIEQFLYHFPNKLQSSGHTLLYSGKRDGFAASTFHSKCDGQGRTLTIIKSNSHLFGGYTEQTWSYYVGPNNYVNYRADSKSFIFSIKNDYEHLYRPFIMEPKAGVNGVIYTQPGSGPIFGTGHDLYISNYCNSNSESYANLGNTYLFSFFAQGTSQANNFLAGSNRFMCEEIEVYRIY